MIFIYNSANMCDLLYLFIEFRYNQFWLFNIYSKYLNIYSLLNIYIYYTGHTDFTTVEAFITNPVYRLETAVKFEK